MSPAVGRHARRGPAALALIEDAYGASAADHDVRKTLRALIEMVSHQCPRGPCKLHYYRSVSGRHGTDVFLSYPENEPIRKASEQPCRGGHSQRPVERSEKPKEDDECDRRQYKVPDVFSASMVGEGAGPSATVHHILTKQRNCAVPWKVRND